MILYDSGLAQEPCQDFVFAWPAGLSHVRIFFAWASWAEPCQDFFRAVKTNPDTAENEFPDTGCPGVQGAQCMTCENLCTQDEIARLTRL